MATRRCEFGGIIALCFCSASVLADHPSVVLGIGGAGPIQTLSAHPIPRGTWAFGFQSDVLDNAQFSDTQLENFATNDVEGVHSIDYIATLSVSGVYGVTDNLSLSARLPYIERHNIREGELEAGVAEAHVHGDAVGFGDLVLLGNYRLLKHNSGLLALQLGVKLPTGETDIKDAEGVRFETEFQPGSGSWDFLAGVALQQTWESLDFYANVLYNKTTKGSQSTQIGDGLTYNMALAYSFNPQTHVGHAHRHTAALAHGIQWDFILELNGEKRRKNQISGQSEDNSGGHVVFLSPGIRVTSGALNGFISVGVPIRDTPSGEQTEVKTRFLLGLSYAF